MRCLAPQFNWLIALPSDHLFENLFQLNSDNKLNSFLKIIGLQTYFEPIKGRYDTEPWTDGPSANDHETGIISNISEAHWVDEIAKRFFPLAFFIFNIVFWTHVRNQPSIETKLLDEGFIQFQ